VIVTLLIRSTILDVAKNPVSVVESKSRPGEGAMIDIVRKVTPRADGGTSLEVGLDLANAVVPERRYVADVASLKFTADRVYLCFGQSKLTGGLRSLLVIYMTPEAAGQFLKICEGNNFRESMTKAFQKERWPVATLATVEEEPAQTVALTANLLAAGFSGREACIDFYHASPFAMAQFRTESRRVPIYPVVRIDFPANLFVAILEALEQHREDLPQDQGV
jgi:hypothetical protein